MNKRMRKFRKLRIKDEEKEEEEGKAKIYKPQFHKENKSRYRSSKIMK